MKWFIISLVLSVLFALARAVGGPFSALLYSDWITCEHNKDITLDVSQVQLFFYDFQNDVNISHPIDSAVDGVTSAYNLDVTKKLIFFVPGYKSHISKKTENLIRDTFKNVKDVYLIIIDHSAYTSKEGGSIKSYERSVFYTYHIGKALGKVLSGFHDKGIKSENIHCIGHSLGSQMLANAGVVYQNMTSQNISRITGIDPAGPCFSNSFIEDQIRAGVANYVEVYHCNAGGLGTTSVLADTDFFFNNGRQEPKCGASWYNPKGESDSFKCSHKKCLRYYAMTVGRPELFPAWQCESYERFNDGKCAGNEQTMAGYRNPGNATGKFYVSTRLYGIE